MSAHAGPIIAPVSARRRRTDSIGRGVLLAATLIALVPLFLVVYYLLQKGLGAISWDFFTTDPSGRFLGDPGGIKSAIIGTILIVLLATGSRSRSASASRSSSSSTARSRRSPTSSATSST